MKHYLFTLFTSIALVAVCQAESYTLILNRPDKIGNKAEISVKGVNQMLEFKREAAPGKVRLVRVGKVNGIDCCILSANMAPTITGIKGLPKGAELTETSFKMAVSVAVPIDRTIPELGCKVSIDFACKGNVHTGDGAAGKLKVVSMLSREETLKPIK